MRLPLLVSIAFLLSACAQSPAPDAPEPDAPAAAVPESFTFACAGGTHFSVRYDADADIADVAAGGRHYTLTRAVSGSGARYAAGGVEFWEHQGEASLTGAAGGPYQDCRA